MIRSLRKRHYLIWQIWAVLLPLAFIAAYWTRPIFPSQKLVAQNLPEALPQILKEIDNERLKLNLRSDNQGQYQIEIYLKKPFSVPATAVYLKQDKSNKVHSDNWLGNVNSRGLYRFTLKNKDLQGVFLYSLISDQVIESIDFK